MPSLARILTRDPLARLLLFFSLLGAVSLAVFVRTCVTPRVIGPSERIQYTLRGLAIPSEEPEPAWGLLLAGALVVGFPMRWIGLRSFFARAQEVKGVISDVPRDHTRISLRLVGSSASTVIKYSYEFRGTRYSGTHLGPMSLWRHYVDRVGGEIAVLVDPADPKRSVLKERWL